MLDEAAGDGFGNGPAVVPLGHSLTARPYAVEPAAHPSSTGTGTDTGVQSQAFGRVGGASGRASARRGSGRRQATAL
ncbi:hypothetical protein C6Y14_38850 [Streptomyces dioscori]|uniref:Uncharacterized protein n=1 Tax=Streptomyces dioscori TaxID=2109333 RepID=A0A2P8PVL3_9ACTN|nr:hypothetical protein [Streptomyces dioscori]PSM38048.1 hypothetical protein C6Y14_38850 [Streptomyces dioscori]